MITPGFKKLDLPIEQDCSIFPIWAEENGGSISGSRQYSFGNGATGNINIVLPYDAELIAVSFDAEVGNPGTVSLDVMNNDAVAHTTPAFTVKDFELLTTPVKFSAGDCVGFRTNTETGAISDSRVAAWFKVKNAITPVKCSMVTQSGRFYLYADNRWVTDSDDNYGPMYFQYFESGGSGANPILEWEHNGTAISKGQCLKRVHIVGRSNNTQPTDLEFSIHAVQANPLPAWGTGFDSDAEIQSTEIFRGNYQQMVANRHTVYAGALNDKHWGTAEIDHLFTEDSELRLYVRPVGALTGTRFFLHTLTWEFET